MATLHADNTRGASLVSVLVLVVVLGGLAASAVIGVNAMTGSDNATSVLPTMSTTAGSRDGSNGGSGGVGLGSPAARTAEAACRVNAAAATAASALYFANRGGSYPTRWSDLTSSSPPSFALSEHVAINPRNPEELDGNGWKLRMSGGAATAPTFVCT